MNDYDDILIHPKKGKKESNIPADGILLVNPSEARQWHEYLRAAGGRSQFIFHSKLSISANESFFIAGPAIGAPMAAMVMEKLIVLGAKRIILFGWCGAIDKSLRIGDIVVPEYAEAGEGTSGYYSKTARQVVSKKLFSDLSSFLDQQGFEFSDKAVWSTDAIFRESRTYLHRLMTEKKIGAVDMEFSALCAVAQFRGVEFASALVVSDELWGKSWRHGFNSENFVQTKDNTVKTIMKMFNNRENQ